MDDAHTKLVMQALAEAGVGRRLAEAEAVVLERIAYGAGATSWYYCKGVEQLGLLASLLSPGSVVSFYFDGRIARLRRSAVTGEVEARMRNVVRRGGDLVFGALQEDGVRVDAALLCEDEEIDRYLAELPPTAELLFGESQARDHDGTAAITLTLPDRDGIVRDHPH